MRGNATIKSSLKLRVTVYLIGICVLGCLTGFLIFDTPYWMTAIWTALAAVALLASLIRYVSRSEQKLVTFLQSLRQNDFAVGFHETQFSKDYDLHSAFNQLSGIFKSLRSERESQHQLLQVVVEHAAVPLVCFEGSTQEIFLINDAAKELFGVPVIRNTAAFHRVDPELPLLLNQAKDGEKTSFRLSLKGRQLFLSVQSRGIVFGDRRLKLVVFHDVSSELAAKEAETWQKLLRVLTHEISNSAIPLSTLSSYTHELVTEARDGVLTMERREDVLESLRTIDARSKSLKEFVQNFRNVNQVPEPVVVREDIQDIAAEVVRLFARDLEAQSIALDFRRSDFDTFAFADRNLTSQVMINLIKNGVEAMTNLRSGKKITVLITREGRFVQVHIGDTGAGISDEELDQIFIPFYSTKKGGSGIGLSISQQIMQRQRGDISVKSTPGKGSVFTLSFHS